jgi:hypothetical protein
VSAFIFVILVICSSALLIKYLDNKAYYYYNEFSIIDCGEITKTYAPDVLQQEAGYYYKRRTNQAGGFNLNLNA